MANPDAPAVHIGRDVEAITKSSVSTPNVFPTQLLSKAWENLQVDASIHGTNTVQAARSVSEQAYWIT